MLFVRSQINSEFHRIIFKRGSIDCLYHYCYLEYLVCSVLLLPLYGNTTFSGFISHVSSATMWLVQSELILNMWAYELQWSKSAVEQLCIGSCVRVCLVYWDPGWNVVHDVRRHNTRWWWSLSFEICNVDGSYWTRTKPFRSDVPHQRMSPFCLPVSYVNNTVIFYFYKSIFTSWS